MPAARDGGARVQLQMAPDGARLVVERILDVCGAAALLLVLSPVMAAAAIAIKPDERGSVIYAQRRYGLNRRTFQMFKFRTMVRDADAAPGDTRNPATKRGPVFKIANDPGSLRSAASFGARRSTSCRSLQRASRATCRSSAHGRFRFVTSRDSRDGRPAPAERAPRTHLSWQVVDEATSDSKSG